MGVAVALDQPRAFGDLARELRRTLHRFTDEAKPGFDLLLFLVVAMAKRAQGPQLCQHQKPQIAADRRGIDFHAEIDAAKPAFALGHLQNRPRQERRQKLAQFLNGGGKYR